MIDGFASAYRSKLEKRLEDMIGTQRAAVSTGACKTLEDYKDKCGYIRALTDVHNMLDEIAQELVKER